MKRSLQFLVLACCASCRADGGGVSAERQNVAQAAPQYRGPMNDAGILTLAAQMNGSEITGAAAAIPRLQDPSAVSFAHQLMQDHKAMNASLDSARVSRDTAAVPPAQFTTMQVASKVRAQVTTIMPSGPAYDRAWASVQVGAHADALDSLRVWQSQAQDASVKSVLGAAITRVTSHLERARALQSALGAGGSSDSLPKHPLRPVAPDTTGAPSAKPAPKPSAPKDATKKP